MTTLPDIEVAYAAQYPNLEALAQGRVSGQFSEWPQLKVEAAALLRQVATMSELLKSQETVAWMQMMPGPLGSTFKHVVASLDRLADADKYVPLCLKVSLEEEAMIAEYEAQHEPCVHIKGLPCGDCGASREHWLNGWPRIGETAVLMCTQVRCVGCGKFQGLTTVALEESTTYPECNPAWPFDEQQCPVCALRRQPQQQEQSEDKLTARMLALRSRSSV